MFPLSSSPLPHPFSIQTSYKSLLFNVSRVMTRSRRKDLYISKTQITISSICLHHSISLAGLFLSENVNRISWSIIFLVFPFPHKLKGMSPRCCFLGTRNVKFVHVLLTHAKFKGECSLIWLRQIGFHRIPSRLSPPTITYTVNSFQFCIIHFVLIIRQEIRLLTFPSSLNTHIYKSSCLSA